MFSTKKIFLVFSIIISSFSFSQDAEFVNNTWYLHNLILNEEDNTPPTTVDVSYISLHFDDTTSLWSSACNTLYGGPITWDDSNNTFACIYGYSATLIDCDYTFENLYFDFFYVNFDLPFTYQVINNTDNTKTLIITNTDGDQAIYGDYQLSVNSYKKQLVSFYPNPTKDILHLKHGAIQQELNISVIDVNGKIVLNTSNTSLNQIDISNLKKGIYFIKVGTLDGKIQIEKIIKQ